MNYKPSAFLLVMIALTGCLVPGAPHYFYYQSTDRCGMLKATSYPNDIEYSYQPCDLKIDSIFLFEPKLKMFKKMEINTDQKGYHFRKREFIINGNSKRMRKLNALVIKKYHLGKVNYDTLYVANRPALN